MQALFSLAWCFFVACSTDLPLFSHDRMQALSAFSTHYLLHYTAHYV
jgi:hypothetical protein